ncbi:MAG: hypothetical protein A2958_01265 [Candidatus Levybacteria bacterium RIFCSPLOWO2_01_FULL_38_13]|nr:MAG: hypothetical protein A2629_01125 [Candidatus Levybacteria bacterium RIFCSPHIGHO2_01_FULL_41_15]OGH35784.1 MAG: hypothetical protein A2958_01265 [Candidatus Levybacteria bacterium RIFCSPLOWO2_01_FULL_38_13]
MKRIAIILFSTLIALGLIYFFLSLFFPSKHKRQEGEIPTPTKIEERTRIPQSDKIIISGVKTNNFLKSPIQTNSEGDVLFIKEGDFQIAYLTRFSQFIINISTSSSQTRLNAEMAFITKLGVKREEACQLEVKVTSPYVPNPYLAPPRKTLSFCENY